MIVADVFKAFYTGNQNLLPDEVKLVSICHTLDISYTELMRQPAWWVDAYQYLIEGKKKAEAEKAKHRQPKTPRIPVRR